MNGSPRGPLIRLWPTELALHEKKARVPSAIEMRTTLVWVRSIKDIEGEREWVLQS